MRCLTSFHVFLVFSLGFSDASVVVVEGGIMKLVSIYSVTTTSRAGDADSESSLLRSSEDDVSSAQDGWFLRVDGKRGFWITRWHLFGLGF